MSKQMAYDPWLFITAALLVLGGLAVVGFVVIALMRRHYRDTDSVAEAGFTLQNLRDLHAAGELDDEEFLRAKAQLLEQYTRRPGPDNPTEQSDVEQSGPIDGRDEDRN